MRRYRYLPLLSINMIVGQARTPNLFHISELLSITTGYLMSSSLTAAATRADDFSQKNSGVWTPMTLNPSAAYFACQARNCGTVFLQLIHP